MSAAVLIVDNVPHPDTTPVRPAIHPWLWPNVAGLDAPAIAVMWQLLLARGMRVHLNAFEPLVLGLAVWSIYVGDRTLDVLRPATGAWEPVRNRFYRRHFRYLRVAGLLLTALVFLLGYHLLKRSTFRGGLMLTIPLVCYFALVHLAPPSWRASWPREAVVAVLFALGTFLGVWLPDQPSHTRVPGPLILFSLLCWVNCSAIESWEWQAGAVGAPSASARWAARHLSGIGTLIAVLAFSMAFARAAPVSFCLAVSGSGAVLATLGACRSRMPVDVLRVAADAALCTPLLPLACCCLR